MIFMFLENSKYLNEYRHIYISKNKQLQFLNIMDYLGMIKTQEIVHSHI